MEDSIVLSAEQEDAVSAMMSGRNVFLTGEAGTGKSTVVREFRRRCGDECIVLAPTGIAALNAGGSTIHSFFMLPTGLMTVDSVGAFSSWSRIKVIHEARAIIIDEISMVRSDVLSAIDIRLRQAAGGENKRMPFGGKQIIVVGDFFQLPPVVKTLEEAMYMIKRLGGVFAFQSDLWVAAQFKCICLKTVHRQSGDARFLAVLNALRHGRFEAAASVLNESCDKPWTSPLPPVCLCTTNRDAETVNRYACGKIGGAARHFIATVKDVFQESDFPTDADLQLVVGARVMLLCNKRTKEGDLEYVNGDMGVVTGFSDGNGIDAVKVRLDKGVEVLVDSYVWKNLSYVSSEDPKTHRQTVRRVEIGSFEQIPLRLAYAVTIHKSQGLSLDGVYLRLGSGCFSHGQLYTALSRCRTLAGLRLDRPVHKEDLIVAAPVMDFYASPAMTAHGCKSKPSDTMPYYEEAMEYYLKKISPETEQKPLAQQVEFSFDSRIMSHPDIDRLLELEREAALNKYDALALEPILRDLKTGQGVTDGQLLRIGRIIRKYGTGEPIDYIPPDQKLSFIAL